MNGTAEKEWREQLDYFKKVEPGLRSDYKYNGNYVAVAGRMIVDSDEDDFALAKRINKSYSAKGALIAKVPYIKEIKAVSSLEFSI